MPFELYLAFVAASVALMLIPGPNVALIVANSVAHGRKYGLVTMAGTTSAGAAHMVILAFGMAAVMALLAQWFEWLRWIGVAYLVWLGVTAWRALPVDLTTVAPQPKSARAIFLRGFLVSLTNPKTLFFYGAFFPQFVTPGPHAGAQFALLAVTFLALAVLIDGGWALLAARLRGLLATHGRWRNRLTGAAFLAAGLGLATARRAN